MMIILFYVIAVLCIAFVAFNIMDFLSWYWVNGKKVVLIIYRWLKGFIPE